MPMDRRGAADQRVRVGLERFLDGEDDAARRFRGARVGLITNPTGVDAQLRSGIDRLAASRDYQLRALFGPEHGVRGAAQAGEEVGTEIDPRTGVPAYSLYGPMRKPTAEMVRDLDVLIFDIQDAGCRYYTYLYTLSYALEAAAELGIPLVVLDRPNPITGRVTEGNILDMAYASFVGGRPIPMRTGLTIGELALLFNRQQPQAADLMVVRMEGWRRSLWYDQTGLPFVPPSPNCPTVDSLTLYPGTCLFEGTVFSEGRGTTRPFEIIGGPGIDPYRWAEELQRLRLPGVAFRPLWFTPTFSKHQGTLCGGVQVHLVERDQVRAVDVGVHLLASARRLFPEQFAWRRPANETGKWFIDLLAGGRQLRDRLEESGGDLGAVQELLCQWHEESERFAQEQAAVVRLYQE